MTVTAAATHPFVPPTRVTPSEVNPMPGLVDPTPVAPEVLVPPTETNIPPTTTTGQSGNINFELLRLVFNINFNGCNCSPTQCMPQPTQDQGCAPPGQGLKTDPDGTVTTAGGYKIKALGDQSAWTITGPDGKELTKVWGDPHVKEGDGTKWDFTKSSNFTLPDGTRIGCKTTSETGKSVSAALDIANGNDRVQIDGINSKEPKTGAVGPGGVKEWQAANAGRDTFDLRGDGTKQDWVKYDPNGGMKGVIIGAKLEDGSYQQETTGADSALARGNGANNGLTTNPDGSVSSNPYQQLMQSLGLGGLERLFGGMGGLDQLFGLGGLGGMNGLSGMNGMNGTGGLEQLLGGMGGMGQWGQSPYAALQAFAALQQLMSGSYRANAQLDYMRYNTTYR